MKKNTQPSIQTLKKALASENLILFAYLFGSCAAGDFTALSDVDIAVSPEKKLNIDDRLGIIHRLSKATKLDNLDISFLDRVDNLYFLIEMIDQGVVLLDRDPDRRELFEVRTRHDFIDFQYQRKLYMGV